MNISKFLFSVSVAGALFLGGCSDNTDTITMSGDPLADEEGLGDDESNSDSEDVEGEDSEDDESSVKAKSSSSKAKSSASSKDEDSKDAKSSASTKDEDSKDTKSSASAKDEDSKDDKSSASAKDDDSKGDEAKPSSSSSVKKHIPGMDDDDDDVESSSSITVKISSSSAEKVVSSSAKDDGKVSSSNAPTAKSSSSSNTPAANSSSSFDGDYGDGSKTVFNGDTTASIGKDNMDSVSSSQSSLLDSLKQEFENDSTDKPDNFDILDSGDINFGKIDTIYSYFCFTGDNEWLRIDFESMAKSGLPFLRNGRAWGLRKKYAVRFEEACNAVYVMRKQ